VQGLDEPDYTISARHNEYEVREYGPALYAQVSVSGSWTEAMARGYSLLWAYLGGDNITAESVAEKRPIGLEPQSENIADAAPVLQQEKAGVWLVSFVLPSDKTLVNLPRPNDPRVRIVQTPARTAAVLKFSGRMTKEDAAQGEARLRELLAADKAVILGPAMTAQYHLPWTPPFLRRNEVIIPIR
jgi:hypothetical protein